MQKLSPWFEKHHPGHLSPYLLKETVRQEDLVYESTAERQVTLLLSSVALPPHHQGLGQHCILPGHQACQMQSLLLALLPQASLQMSMPHRMLPPMLAMSTPQRRARPRVSQTIFCVPQEPLVDVLGESTWSGSYHWRGVKVRTGHEEHWGRAAVEASWLQSSAQLLYPTTAQLQLFISPCFRRLKAQRFKLILSGRTLFSAVSLESLSMETRHCSLIFRAKFCSSWSA